MVWFGKQTNIAEMKLNTRMTTQANIYIYIYIHIYRSTDHTNENE
jgi:hypothetical protein